MKRAVCALLACCSIAACSEEPVRRPVDAGIESDASVAPSDGSATSDASVDAGPLVPVEDCAEIPAPECFSNEECAVDRRCENRGTAEVPVSCCVPGVRGTGQAGMTCERESDCASSICILGDSIALCSKTCNTIEDCPVGMKRCMQIAFTTSTDNWCFPEN